MKFNSTVPSQRLGKHCLCAEAIMKVEQGNVMCSGSVSTVATHGVTTSSPCASDCVWARVYSRQKLKQMSLGVLLFCL